MAYTLDMKKTLSIIVVALAVAGVASAENLRGMIRTMDKKIHHAFMTRNGDEFEKITRAGVTSDFKYTENGKTMTYDEMLAEMKQSFGMMVKMESADSKTLSLSQHGDEATARTQHRMVSIVNGPDKKTHKMVYSGVSKDGYRKEDGQWKLASMEWVSEKMTMDGKPAHM